MILLAGLRFNDCNLQGLLLNALLPTTIFTSCACIRFFFFTWDIWKFAIGLGGLGRGVGPLLELDFPFTVCY